MHRVQLFSPGMALESAHLELLAALLDNTTLAAASRTISLSPSAASRRLQDAERLVGVALTEKSGRTISLTPAGRLLAEAASASARRLSEAELAARWLGATGPRPVRIGVEFFDAVAWLLPHQDVAPYEVVRTTGLNRSGTDFTAIDLMIDAVGSDPATFDDQNWKVLGVDQLALVVGAGNPLAKASQIAVSDIVGERYLAGSADPIPGFEFERFFLPSGDCPKDIITIASFSLLMDLVARNDGVTIQPSKAVAKNQRPGLTVVPLDRSIPIAWVVARCDRSDQRVGRLLESFGDLFD